MELMQGLLLITVVHTLAAASPGPDFVLVTQQTLSNGRKAGLMCSVGIALGLSVHIIYSALGLAAVIANSSSLLWGIKILGGCYLIYLGINGLKASPATDVGSVQEEKATDSTTKSIGLGFLCNLLNPKAPIYFISLFTLVLSPQMPLYQIAIYGVWIMILQFCWFAFVTVILSKPAVNSRFKKFAHWVDRVLGGAMVILGLKVILSKAS